MTRKPHRMLALGLTAILALAMVGAWLITSLQRLHLHPRYAASSLLVLSRPLTPGLNDLQPPALEQASALSFRNFQATQAVYITSRPVLQKALGDPEIAALPLVLDQPDPAAWLSENLKVKFQGRIMTIDLEGEDPNDLTLLVNAVTDAYLVQVVDREAQEKSSRLEELKRVASQYRQLLEKKRGADEPDTAHGDSVVKNLESVLSNLDREVARSQRELDAPAQVRLLQKAEVVRLISRFPHFW